MMARTQITLEPEVQRRARQRASDLGVSFAEYVRRLMIHDLGAPRVATGLECVFDLGSSAGSDIAKDKKSMIAEAFAGEARRPPRRRKIHR
jgi:hypothetical protein